MKLIGLGVAHLEMGGAGHPVELVQIVGQHAAVVEPLAQLGQGVGVVVDAGEQHRLVEQGDAGPAQWAQAVGQLFGDLPGMVGMEHHHQGQGAVGEQSGEAVVEAVGEHHRGAGVDAQPPDAGQPGQGGEEFSEPGIVEHQGIAAAENHFAQAGFGGQGVEHRLPVAPGARLAVRKMAPKAVAAVNGAGARGHHQGTSSVFVQHPGAPAGGLVAGGVGDEPRRLAALVGQWQNLTQQGVVGVSGRHQAGVVAGHFEPKGLLGAARGPFRRQIEKGQQRLGGAEGLGHLPLPAPWLPWREGKGYHCVFHHQGPGPNPYDRANTEEQMATYSTNEFRGGLKLLLDGDPCVIIENEFVKPGKGQAFNRVKLRNLKTGRVLEKTFKSGETVEAADVIDRDLQYLYTDGEYWYFMDPENYEQYQADANAMGDAVKWVKDQDVCNVTLWNGQPIAVEAPNFVVLEVTDTDPGLKGDTSGGGGKPATLETGAVVRVPLFVQIGEKIKVDTRKGEYVSRAKD